ncbi:hypothetical protein Ahy_B05g079181 isoform C [Arachis hypogaea]|uniref:Uncharacterized protein n=1 Tax=Arachis hypogaea TaxID=3818 RepID=A0A444Z944_ARAHY|nr:hypothetical protein Ahy_B05g079181 isoform C [Arachis hypogaea]
MFCNISFALEVVEPIYTFGFGIELYHQSRVLVENIKENVNKTPDKLTDLNLLIFCWVLIIHDPATANERCHNYILKLLIAESDPATSRDSLYGTVCLFMHDICAFSLPFRLLFFDTCGRTGESTPGSSANTVFLGLMRMSMLQLH